MNQFHGSNAPDWDILGKPLGNSNQNWARHLMPAGERQFIDIQNSDWNSADEFGIASFGALDFHPIRSIGIHKASKRIPIKQ